MSSSSSRAARAALRSLERTGWRLAAAEREAEKLDAEMLGLRATLSVLEAMHAARTRR